MRDGEKRKYVSSVGVCSCVCGDSVPDLGIGGRRPQPPFHGLPLHWVCPSWGRVMKVHIGCGGAPVLPEI